jgi:hypothetical protein
MPTAPSKFGRIIAMKRPGYIACIGILRKAICAIFTFIGASLSVQLNTSVAQGGMLKDV